MNQPVMRPVVGQVLHSLAVGGAEFLARQFAQQSAGEVTTVFACLDTLGELGEGLRHQGYCVEVLGRRPGFDYDVARRLAAFCREHQVSVLHAHQYAPFFYASLSRLPWSRPPVLFTEHGRTFPDFRRPKRIIANRCLLRRRDRVVAVGQHVRQALIDNEGLPPDRIDVIYNGIALDQYASSTIEKPALRRQLGLPESSFIVVQVARLNALKDHATAIRVMQRLAATRQDILLVIVGDGEERPRLETLIEQARVHDSVRLVGRRHDVASFLHAADVFLLTSVSEGIPLTVIEAMAAGLPCVATDVGGVSEVVIDGQCGLLAPAGNDEALSQHLATLVTDGRRRRAMGESGRQRAFSTFSDRTMHTAYRKLYLEMGAPL